MGKKHQKPLALDMPFQEALERFAGVTKASLDLEKIRVAVASEAARCVEARDADGGAELITVLVTGLALAISSQARGSKQIANDFAEAAGQLLMSEVVRFQPLSEFMSPRTP